MSELLIFSPRFLKSLLYNKSLTFAPAHSGLRRTAFPLQHIQCLASARSMVISLRRVERVPGLVARHNCCGSRFV